MLSQFAEDRRVVYRRLYQEVAETWNFLVLKDTNLTHLRAHDTACVHFPPMSHTGDTRSADFLYAPFPSHGAMPPAKRPRAIVSIVGDALGQHGGHVGMSVGAVIEARLDAKNMGLSAGRSAGSAKPVRMEQMLARRREDAAAALLSQARRGARAALDGPRGPRRQGKPGSTQGGTQGGTQKGKQRGKQGGTPGGQSSPPPASARLRYRDCEVVHEAWREYIATAVNVAGKGGVAGAARQLLQSDLHGALLQVVRARCPHHVGATGIVVQETVNAFRLITERDKVVMLPKKGTQFTLQHAGHLFVLDGDSPALRREPSARGQ